LARRDDVDIVLAMTERIRTNQGVIDRLTEGNRRFVEGNGSRLTREELEHRARLAAGQAPDAVILTCADSRVPPALVFDQGLGDLFVIRVAGNVVTPELLGSVEFAVANLGTPVVMVLGHTGCGAVTAAVDALADNGAGLSTNLRSIIDRIRPAAEEAVREVLGRSPDGHPLGDDAGPAGESARRGAEGIGLTEDERERVVGRAVRLNVRSAVRDLRAGSELLDDLADSGELTIVGAEYSLKSGRVELLGSA
jgi:carbonic anhydrase